MKLSQYEADTLLMAIRFQLANDHEIIDTEWNDLISVRDRLESHLVKLSELNPFHNYQVSDIEDEVSNG